jgi:hypothetical protein
MEITASIHAGPLYLVFPSVSMIRFASSMQAEGVFRQTRGIPLM